MEEALGTCNLDGGREGERDHVLWMVPTVPYNFIKFLVIKIFILTIHLMIFGFYIRFHLMD